MFSFEKTKSDKGIGRIESLNVSLGWAFLLNSGCANPIELLQSRVPQRKRSRHLHSMLCMLSQMALLRYAPVYTPQ